MPPPAAAPAGTFELYALLAPSLTQIAARSLKPRAADASVVISAASAIASALRGEPAALKAGLRLLQPADISRLRLLLQCSRSLSRAPDAAPLLALEAALRGARTESASAFEHGAGAASLDKRNALIHTWLTAAMRAAWRGHSRMRVTASAPVASPPSCRRRLTTLKKAVLRSREKRVAAVIHVSGGAARNEPVLPDILVHAANAARGVLRRAAAAHIAAREVARLWRLAAGPRTTIRSIRPRAPMGLTRPPTPPPLLLAAVRMPRRGAALLLPSVLPGHPPLRVSRARLRKAVLHVMREATATATSSSADGGVDALTPATSAGADAREGSSAVVFAAAYVPPAASVIVSAAHVRDAVRVVAAVGAEQRRLCGGSSGDSNASMPIIPTISVVDTTALSLTDFAKQDFHPALDEAAAELLSTASFFQARARNRGSGSGSSGSGERRLVVGLREVQRLCRRGRLQLVIIATNVRCEDADEAGGVASAVAAIASSARACKPPTPIFFALSRKRMSAALGIHASASAVGLTSLEGLRDVAGRALSLAALLCRNWAHRKHGEALENVMTVLPPEHASVPSPAPTVLPTTFSLEPTPTNAVPREAAVSAHSPVSSPRPAPAPTLLRAAAAPFVPHATQLSKTASS